MARITKQVLIDALTKQGVALTGDETLAGLKQLIEDNAIMRTRTSRSRSLPRRLRRPAPPSL